MAYEQPGFMFSNLPAAADLSGKQFYLVKTSGGQIALCSAATDRPIGVLQNEPRAGEAAVVMVNGITKIVTAAGLAADAVFGTDANGKAVALTVGTDTTKYMAGSMIEATGAANGIGTALISCGAPARAA